MGKHHQLSNAANENGQVDKRGYFIVLCQKVKSASTSSVGSTSMNVFQKHLQNIVFQLSILLKQFVA